MQAIKSIGWIVGLSIVTGGLIATPARADRSYSDITGTQLWNNHAPVFETDSVLDPELAARVARLNQEGEQAYQACIAAIAQIEQNAPTERRFARRPSTATAEVPVACRQLEELRAEAENLRVTLQDVERSRTSSAYATW